MTEALQSLAALGAVGVTPSLAILGVRRRDRSRWQAELVPHRLEFAGDVDVAGITAFLGGLSGLLPTRWRQPFVSRGVGIEIVATHSGITHYLLVPKSQADIVQSHLRAALPNVALSPNAEFTAPGPTLAGELATANAHHQLQVSNGEAVSAAVLAALQPLDTGEAMTVQILARPLGMTSPRPGAVDPASWITRLSRTTPQSVAKPPKAVQDKYRHPLFAASLRLGVTSASPARDRQLLARLTAAFHAANSPDATLRRRRRASTLVRRALVRRTPALVNWPCHLNAPELAGLMAWPPVGVNLPGLAIGGCRKIAPSAKVPTTGIVIADSNFPGTSRPLALGVVDALMHEHVIGPSGAGKSTLLVSEITQAIEAGHGVVVVDPKADLVADCLDRIPENRIDDVIVLDPTDDERPIGLNPLQGGIDAPELVAEQVLGTWHRLYKASWGPRTDDVLRAALLSLVSIPGMTIVEVPLLLSDAAFRRQIVSQIDDPIGLEPFWTAFDAQTEAERAQVIGPVLNKLRAVVVRRRLRSIFGQATPALDFDQLLANGKILFVPLSAGTLGEDAAALLGALVMSQLWMAVQRRAGQPASARRPVFCFIDEFQDVCRLPLPLPQVLAQARGLGFGLTLAHQNLAQLDREMQEAVLANCRTRVIFRTSASDAHRLAREVEPHLGWRDLQGLGAHEVVATIAVGSGTMPPATGLTRPAPPTTGSAALVRRRSREHYGRDRAAVEAELRSRHEQSANDGPVGRQRRSA